MVVGKANTFAYDYDMSNGAAKQITPNWAAANYKEIGHGKEEADGLILCGGFTDLQVHQKPVKKSSLARPPGQTFPET